MRTSLTVALVVVMVHLLGGCAGPPKPASRATGPAAPPPPSYREVAERYNRHIERIDRLWARGVVELRWRENKRYRFEQADAHLMMILPDQVALPIGKASKRLFWAGSNAERYWLFDMIDQRKLYVGEHRTSDGAADASADSGAQPPMNSPLPFRPLDLPRLLGLVALDPYAEGDAAVVEVAGPHWLIEPPGTRTRILLDPETALPARVDLLDERGWSIVVSRLSNYELMELVDAPPGVYPRIATKASIELVGEAGRMDLFLHDASNAPRRIKPIQFDLEHLIKALGPVEVIDLDAEQEQPE